MVWFRFASEAHNLCPWQTLSSAHHRTFPTSTLLSCVFVCVCLGFETVACLSSHMLVSAKAFALKHEMTQGKELALYSAAVLQSLRPLTVYVRSAKMEPKILIDKASHLFFGRSASVPLLLAHWTLKGLQSWERPCMQKVVSHSIL